MLSTIRHPFVLLSSVLFPGSGPDGPGQNLPLWVCRLTEAAPHGDTMITPGGCTDTLARGRASEGCSFSEAQQEPAPGSWGVDTAVATPPRLQVSVGQREPESAGLGHRGVLVNTVAAAVGPSDREPAVW
ncbi:unnamed protein product [Boreogadus saida]